MGVHVPSAFLTIFPWAAQCRWCCVPRMMLRVTWWKQVWMDSRSWRCHPWPSLPATHDLASRYWPNPATEAVQVNWSGAPATLEILDMAGRVVRSNTVVLQGTNSDPARLRTRCLSGTDPWERNAGNTALDRAIRTTACASCRRNARSSTARRQEGHREAWPWKGPHRPFRVLLSAGTTGLA